MKLSDVLDVLLKAEENALGMKIDADHEAETVKSEAHSVFEAEQEAALSKARAEARARVEAAGHAADVESLQISEQSKKVCEKMKANFAEHVPSIIAKLAEELAARHAAEGRG
ncbi:MAG: hypothetical protein LBR38_07160 [Synergistaceae bacterium]|jgi:hypothetical protein|nr:hypothetical protein [Synergistaceae bacterium]